LFFITHDSPEDLQTLWGVHPKGGKQLFFKYTNQLLDFTFLDLIDLGSGPAIEEVPTAGRS